MNKQSKIIILLLIIILILCSVLTIGYFYFFNKGFFSNSEKTPLIDDKTNMAEKPSQLEKITSDYIVKLTSDGTFIYKDTCFEFTFPNNWYLLNSSDPCNTILLTDGTFVWEVINGPTITGGGFGFANDGIGYEDTILTEFTNVKPTYKESIEAKMLHKYLKGSEFPLLKKPDPERFYWDFSILFTKYEPDAINYGIYDENQNTGYPKYYGIRYSLLSARDQDLDINNAEEISADLFIEHDNESLEKAILELDTITNSLKISDNELPNCEIAYEAGKIKNINDVELTPEGTTFNQGDTLYISGELVGTWMFEGYSTIELQNKDNLRISDGDIRTSQYWGTEELLPFTGSIKIPQDAPSGNYKLVIYRNEPRGDGYCLAVFANIDIE